MIAEAIILAGGLGTRLRPVTGELPKPLAPVAGRPFITYLLDYLLTYNIGQVIISCGYKAADIKNTLGNNYREMQISYAEEPEPLGTGGALKYAASMVSGTAFFCLNGDSYFPVDLKKMYDYHRRLGADITLAARTVEDASRYGALLSDQQGFITGFREKGISGPGLINAGVYLLNPGILNDYPEKFSFENDLLQSNHGKLKLAAFQDEGYFIDIGIPEDYRRAQTELTQQTGNDKNG